MLGKRKYDNVDDDDNVTVDHTQVQGDNSASKKRKIDDDAPMYKYHKCLPPKLHESIRNEMRVWRVEFMKQLDVFYDVFEKKISTKQTITTEEWKSFEQALQLILR
jgi:hypothetical protein